MDNATFKISFSDFLLDERLVARVSPRESFFVADRNMRVNHSIFSCNVRLSISIVRLTDLVQFEPAGLCLSISVCDAVGFRVAVEWMFAMRLRE